MIQDEHDLELLIGSRFPIIAMETQEEARAVDLLRRCAERLRLPVRTWTVTSGLSAGPPSPRAAAPQDPAAALREVARAGAAGLYVWLDFHPFLANPLHVRLLKEIAGDYDRVARTSVLLGYQVTIPAEIEKMAVRFTMTLPDRDAILGIVRQEVADWQRRHGGAELKGQREVFDLMLRHLTGLSEVDVRRLVRYSFQDDGLIDGDDLPRLVEQKHAILARDSVLSFEIETARFSDVAGLAALKAWLDRRRAPFLGEDSAKGLDVPKGIMLLGVQGCGKSLAAKAVAGAWGVPLHAPRLRRAVRQVHWRDGAQPARGAEGGRRDGAVRAVDRRNRKGRRAGRQRRRDGGVSQRVLGALLTWMAERKSRGVPRRDRERHRVAAAGTGAQGPLRRDLLRRPAGPAVRDGIFRIHLRKRGQDPGTFALDKLAGATAGFTGAEIEQAVVSALYEANARQQALGDEHILAEIARTRPLSVVMAERIARLRAWAIDRTVMAD